MNQETNSTASCNKNLLSLQFRPSRELRTLPHWATGLQEFAFPSLPSSELGPSPLLCCPSEQRILCDVVALGAPCLPPPSRCPCLRCQGLGDSASLKILGVCRARSLG